jgi:hypothetical protein
MHVLTIAVTDEVHKKLEKRERRWDVPTEDFVVFAIEDALRREANVDAAGEFGIVQ